jgi:hypothetical protein
MKKIFVVVALMFFLTGCEPEDKKSVAEAPASVEKIQTVEWYLDHETERTAKLEECHNNPGILKDNANCQNANSAGLQLSAGTLHKVNW